MTIAFVFPHNGHAQNDIEEISNVPISIEGDGLSGHVDFRAKAACVDHNIQLAVDKIVVSGVTVNGVYYRGDDIEGYSFPLEVPIKGNLYLRGYVSISNSVGSKSNYRIKPGSIGASLSGFLDWISLKEGEASFITTCPDWKAFVGNGLNGYGLEIYKEELLGDGLFRKLQSMVNKMEGDKAYLEKLNRLYQKAESSTDFKSLLNKIDQYNWTVTYLPRAKSLKESIAYDLENAKEEEKNTVEEAEEVNNSTAASSVTTKSDTNKEEKESKTARTTKSQDLEIENQVKYDNNMSIAREYEYSGNSRKALEFYQKADRYKSTSESQAKVNYYEGLVSTQNAARSAVSSILERQKEKKREEKRIRQAKLENTRDARQQIKNEADNKKYDSFKKIFLQLSESSEDYFMSQYQYYDCVEKTAHLLSHYENNYEECLVYMSAPPEESHIIHNTGELLRKTTAQDLYLSYKRKKQKYKAYRHFSSRIEDLLDKAIAKDPDNSLYAYEKSQNQDEIDEKIKWLAKAVELDPGNTSYRKEYNKILATAGGKREEFLKRNLKNDGGSFVDPRDGKRYKTVYIGKQRWMSENLNYEMNGSKPHKTSGRVYTFPAAREACPKGWRLPTTSDWEELKNTVYNDFYKAVPPQEREGPGAHLLGKRYNNYGFNAVIFDYAYIFIGGVHSKSGKKALKVKRALRKGKVKNYDSYVLSKKLQYYNSSAAVYWCYDLPKVTGYGPDPVPQVHIASLHNDYGEFLIRPDGSSSGVSLRSCRCVEENK